ncbi:MAG TPA: NAD(+) diphosphatase [Psychrobacter sp.]|uniref:NAD(+) diphosphatase n=1 Tax=Psychrobacter sp. TaxID=56811 RepID=UPI002C33D01A|nr:NAD(+) diphosphatase [Psychrobacter sp.]HSP85932.1 NAD(+) diphosphatase [Psychrobacter sp.]
MIICAFVLSDETILCRQTPNGWWPLQVQLPHSDVSSEQAYQLGQVTLFDSLAPNSWLLNDGIQKEDNANTITVHASCAITYEYAIANNIALPDILDSSDLESSDLQSSGNRISDSKSNITAFVPYRQLITQLPSALSAQLSQAIQLLRWQADTNFCSRCAAPVVHAKQAERAMVCQACHLRQYPRVQPCVITAITRPNPQTGETQILLAHHHRYGQQKTSQQALQYGLIAGFVEVGESLEHAVVREVAEEVGISLSDIRYVSSQPWPFPSNLMLGFRASYADGDIVIQEDELSHADFFDLSKLPKIPFKGSIAYALIEQIANEQGVAI